MAAATSSCTSRTIRTPVEVDIDEPTLKAIASKTGGKYYRADSTDTLRRIYDAYRTDIAEARHLVK